MAILLCLLFLQNSIFKSNVPSMLQSAQAFVNALDQKQLKKATYSLADEERYNWNFTPVSRQGLPLKEMTAEQQQAAFTLMQASLSEKGYQKAQELRELEEILRGVEGRGSDDKYRDPNNYYFTIFGKPAQDEAWGWRFEGHHISLNFSSVSDKIVSVTPTFYGANPAKVPAGPRKGWRILKPEEDLGRKLVKSLSTEQQKEALIATEAYPDIVTSNDKVANISKMEGLAYSQMNSDQQSLLLQLIEVYYSVHKAEIAKEAIQRIKKAGLEKLRFAWAGSYEVGDKHYYRIHGSGFVIEYDNTQNDANHIHTVIRDFENDFGENILKQHYEEAHN